MKKIIILWAVTICLLTACSSRERIEPSTGTLEVETTKTNASTHYESEETLSEWNREVGGAYEPFLTSYDAGSRTYQAQSGKVMPYEVRGIVAMPKEPGNYPMVLITHGSHANENDNRRFDTGFTYLAEALASEGYVAVSMDMSGPYQWKYGDGDDKEKSIAVAAEHIRLLQTLDQNPEGFPEELKGKIDWNLVSLLGHSRGGETIFDIALDQQEKGLQVASLFALAPTAPADLESKSWPDVPTVILVPEYDGDVVSLDGFAIQKVLEKQVESPSMVLMVGGANHNYFNTELTMNDGLHYREESQLTDQLDPKAQQDFLTACVLDFLDGKIPDSGSVLPNRMYGQNVILRTSNVSDQVILKAEDLQKLQSQNLTIGVVADSWFYEEDQVLADVGTFGQGEEKARNLLEMRWEEKGASFRFQPENGDFSSHSSLSVFALSDPAGKENQGLAYQRFSVTLKDKKGNQATVRLKDQRNSLRLVPGKLAVTPLPDREVYFWSSMTPIPITGISLSSFQGVELSQIESVIFTMDQTEKGGLYLERILLQ